MDIFEGNHRVCGSQYWQKPLPEAGGSISTLSLEIFLMVHNNHPWPERAYHLQKARDILDTIRIASIK